MTKQSQIEFAETVYHITSRRNSKQVIFLDEEDFANFLRALCQLVKKLKSGKIIPIHTFHPDKYGGLFSRKIEQVSDGEVFVV